MCGVGDFDVEREQHVFAQQLAGVRVVLNHGCDLL